MLGVSRRDRPMKMEEESKEKHNKKRFGKRETKKPEPHVAKPVRKLKFCKGNVRARVCALVGNRGPLNGWPTKRAGEK